MRFGSRLTLLATLALGLAACGGHSALPGDTIPGDGVDGGVQGAVCSFDTDCTPPDYICDTVSNTCVQGCSLNPNCPTGKVCNQATGRCVVGGSGQPDGGPDGGTTGGGNDGGTGTASDTLCHACTTNSDCHAGGLCVSNSNHTANFCTQDCTNDACPTDYRCTLDRTGTKHQCYPVSGDCSAVQGQPDGGSDGGTGGTDAGDPSAPSDNPNGCGTCGQCNVNNDCVTGSLCVNGTCAGSCDNFGWVDCALGGAALSTCQDLGNGHKYCLPLIGLCLPGIPKPLGGDNGCVPTVTNTSCSPGSIPGNTSFGTNTAITQGISPQPALAAQDSIAVDSQGRMVIAFAQVDGNGVSTIGVSQSADSGAHWAFKGKLTATTPVQSDPVVTVSKWTDAGGTHERFHLAWLGYTLTQSGSTYNASDMFVETSYSDDGGLNWQAGQRATTTTDNSSGTLILDKPWITASADAAQTLLITFSIGAPNQYQHLHALASNDHGGSWRPSVQVENGTNDHGHTQGMAAFDPADASGQTVYAAYLSYDNVGAVTTNQILLAKSTDRGNTWGTPVVISGATDQVLFDAPSIAADNAHHLFIGYAAATGSNQPAFWDPIVATVDASGSNPVVARTSRIADDQGGCFQHYHVTTAVNRATGAVYAGFADNRAPNGQGAIWYAASSDQGSTWSANKLVSDALFEFIPDANTAQKKWLGDYFGFVFDGTRLRAAWSDPRNGSSSQVEYAGGTP